MNFDVFDVNFATEPSTAEIFEMCPYKFSYSSHFPGFQVSMRNLINIWNKGVLLLNL